MKLATVYTPHSIGVRYAAFGVVLLGLSSIVAAPVNAVGYKQYIGHAAQPAHAMLAQSDDLDRVGTVASAQHRPYIGHAAQLAHTVASQVKIKKDLSTSILAADLSHVGHAAQWANAVARSKLDRPFSAGP